MAVFQNGLQRSVGIFPDTRDAATAVTPSAFSGDYSSSLAQDILDRNTLERDAAIAKRRQSSEEMLRSASRESRTNADTLEKAADLIATSKPQPPRPEQPTNR